MDDSIGFPNVLQDAEGENEPTQRIESGEIDASEPSLFKDVSLETPDGKRKLVNDLDLKIDSGSRLLIAGASGGGKSSLLRAFAGLWTSEVVILRVLL